jgi:hypothetical protein
MDDLMESLGQAIDGLVDMAEGKSVECVYKCENGNVTVLMLTNKNTFYKMLPILLGDSSQKIVYSPIRILTLCLTIFSPNLKHFIDGESQERRSAFSLIYSIYYLHNFI